MIDYKLLTALAMVVQEGGFERAAKVLFLTQSAISQRVRQLEDQCGQLLLTRMTPPQPTEAGKVLLKHYQQVQMLESGLHQALNGTAADKPQQIALGINADSLDYWFLDAVLPLLKEGRLLLDLRVADQEETHRYLKDGDVIGCISTEPRAMAGCRVDQLGEMTYRMVATKEFIERWFPNGLTLEALEVAPAVLFNRSDGLHQLFMEKYVTPDRVICPVNYIPAPNQYLQLIAAGTCYGMLPDWQAKKLLHEERIREFIGGAVVAVRLYWHRWNIAAPALELLTQHLLQGAQKYLQRT